jgi:hypothetical protein
MAWPSCAGLTTWRRATFSRTELRKMPPPAGDDPRIDLREAQAAEWVGDPSRARTAALHAEEKGASSGAPLIVALAKKFEGASSSELGDRQRALAAYEESRRLFIEAGENRTDA